jgi:hypothetical protein
VRARASGRRAQEEINMMFDFKNAGEIWSFIGTIGSLLVASIALTPIFKEFIHKQKSKEIVRNQLVFELMIIHESFFGKILSQLSLFQKDDIFPYKIPIKEISYFEKLEEIYKTMVYLSGEEKRCTANLINEFRKAEYRKLDNDYLLMMSNSVFEIENLANYLLEKVNEKLGRKGLNHRYHAYSNIHTIAQITNEKYPEYPEIFSLLTT